MDRHWTVQRGARHPITPRPRLLKPLARSTQDTLSKISRETTPVLRTFASPLAPSKKLSMGRGRTGRRRLSSSPVFLVQEKHLSASTSRLDGGTLAKRGLSSYLEMDPSSRCCKKR